MVYHIKMSDIEEFKSYLINNKYSDQTIKCYCDNILRFYYYTPMIDNVSLKRYTQRKPSQQVISSLKLFKNWLVSNKCNESDITYKFPKPRAKIRPDPIYISKDEVYEIMSLMPTEKDRLLTEVIFKGAFRVSEALSIKWGDLDWFNWLNDKDSPIIVNIPQSKKGKNQTTVLPSELARRLFESNIKFHDSRGMPYNDKFLLIDFGLENYKSFEDYVRLRRHNYKDLLYEISVKAIGKKISPHKLRHSYAQYMYDSGVPLEVVSRKLRHSDLKTTQVYAKTSINLVSKYTDKLN